MSELLKIWYGISLFKKSSQGWWVVASYHHPDSITWRWSLSFDGREKKRCWPNFGPGYSMGKKYCSPNGDFSLWIQIPFIGVISFNTQAHMWRSQ